MRKPIFLIILIFLSHSARTQSTNTDRPGRWSYSIHVSATSNNRFLKSSEQENSSKEIRDNNEIQMFSYSAGVLINCRFSDILSINAGLSYDDLGFKTKKGQLIWPDITTTPFFIASHYRYIEIPISLKYSFYRKQPWNLFVSGGISPAIFLQQANILHYKSEGTWTKSSSKKSVGYNKINFIASIQAGVDCRISKRLQLNAGIFYKQFLNATNSNLATKEFLHSSGISFGITYHRRKRTGK